MRTRCQQNRGKIPLHSGRSAFASRPLLARLNAGVRFRDMPEQALRFGVFDNGGRRSATWKCFSPHNKEDVYLSCRELGGALKASLHDSKEWHFAYDDAFYRRAVREEDRTENGRFIEKWQEPKPIAPGVILAFRVVTPWNSVASEDTTPQQVFRVPQPPAGKAIEFDVFLIESTTVVSGWPGKNKMNTSLVGSYQLPNGRSVWVVYWEIPMPNLPKQTGSARLFKGRSIDELRGENLRLLGFLDEPDGSKAIYDCKVTLEKRET